MHRTIKDQKSLRIEQLEPRHLLAGNVNVSMSAGLLSIVGDRYANAVTISPLGGGLARILGSTSSDGSPTTINNKQYVDLALTTPAKVSLGDGNDRLMLQGASPSALLSFPSTLSVALEAGLDYFYAQYLKVDGILSIEMGNDGTNSNESASIFSSNVGGVSYGTGHTAGSNSFNMSGTTVRGDITIIGSVTTDSVVLASDEILGSIYARMGNEPNGSTKQDSFEMTWTNVRAGVNVQMGDGRGVTTLSHVQADTIDVVFGISDSDQLLVNYTKARQAKFDGGTGGKDRVSGQSNLFAAKPTIIGFEQNDLK